MREDLCSSWLKNSHWSEPLFQEFRGPPCLCEMTTETNGDVGVPEWRHQAKSFFRRWVGGQVGSPWRGCLKVVPSESWFISVLVGLWPRSLVPHVPRGTMRGMELRLTARRLRVSPCFMSFLLSRRFHRIREILRVYASRQALGCILWSRWDSRWMKKLFAAREWITGISAM